MPASRPARATGERLFDNQDTGKREHWTTFEMALDHGRVQINLIAYPSELVLEVQGLALYAEQMAQIRQFAEMVPLDQCPDDHARNAAKILRSLMQDPANVEELHAWYVRDLELGNKHRYPPGAGKKGGAHE